MNRALKTSYVFCATVCIVATVLPAKVRGHGTPIRVNVSDDRLVVSHEPNNFPPPIFGEDDEDGDPFGTVTLPSLGSVIVWQLPGFEIFGMDGASNLSIETLTRPVIGATPAQERLLWFWNPNTELVEMSPAEFHLLGSGGRSLTMLPTDQVAPPPFGLADPIAGQQGFHNHGLLSYALDDDLHAPAGVYGFFARLTSNEYNPSEPFLLVFNYGVSYGRVVEAAEVLVAASTPLPGDYNRDGTVDAADYSIWRKTLGSTTELAADGSGNRVVDEDDYGIWRQHFGATIDTATAAANEKGRGVRLVSASVPEPGSVGLVMGVMLFLSARLHGRWFQ